MARIVMTFSPDGKVKVDAQGFKGQTCVKRVEEIMKTLDPKATLKDRTLKPEYYQNVTTTNTNTKV